MTGKNRYAMGRRFEYKVRDLLKQFNYYLIRSAKSAFPDLVAIGLNNTMLVECKKGKYISSKERRAMLSLYEKYCVLPVLAFPEGREVVLCDPRYKNIRRFIRRKGRWIQIGGELIDGL